MKQAFGNDFIRQKNDQLLDNRVKFTKMETMTLNFQNLAFKEIC